MFSIYCFSGIQMKKTQTGLNDLAVSYKLKEIKQNLLTFKEFQFKEKVV